MAILCCDGRRGFAQHAIRRPKKNHSERDSNGFVRGLGSFHEADLGGEHDDCVSFGSIRIPLGIHPSCIAGIPWLEGQATPIQRA